MVRSFKANRFGCEAEVLGAGNVYYVNIQTPLRLDQGWEDMKFTCTCRASMRSRGYQNKRGQSFHEDNVRLWARCSHMACAMYHWEKIHGPWFVETSQEELEEQYQELLEKEKEEKKEQEWEEKSRESLPVLSALKRENKEGTGFYDLEKALAFYDTNAFFAERLGTADLALDVVEKEGKMGAPQLHLKGLVEDLEEEGGQGAWIDLCLEGKRVLKSECSCKWASQKKGMCHHQLMGWWKVWDWVEEHSSLDITDSKAQVILRKLAVNPLEETWREFSKEPEV